MSMSMSRDQSGPIERWISAAKGGCADALGHALEACRPYLLRVANLHLEPDLKAKVGASDLVQETFLEAQRHFAHFNGTSETELLAWLRSILINNALNCGRLYRQTQKRQIDREVNLMDSGQDQVLNEVVDQGETPSGAARAVERDEGLARALGRLPEQYRQVIRWRSYERCSFEEVGRRLDRSADASRKLWIRALNQLEQMLEPPDVSR
jgi:RNA polymerase sigma-70 factor, ECF subfamily